MPDRRHYGETVWLDGRTTAIPRAAPDPALVMSAVARPVCHPATRDDTAADWFRGEYGRALADRVAIPLVEAWSGAPAGELAPTVADKIPEGSSRPSACGPRRSVPHRAVAIGYCGERPQTADVWHVYPEGGVAALCRAVAGELPSDVDPAGRRRSADRRRGDRRGGRVSPTGRASRRPVVSTAPINVCPGPRRGTDALDAFRPFRFRPMIFVNLNCDGEHLLEDVVVWLPGGTPFFRLTEAPQSMPWLAPPRARR